MYRLLLLVQAILVILEAFVDMVIISCLLIVFCLDSDAYVVLKN